MRIPAHHPLRKNRQVMNKALASREAEFRRLSVTPELLIGPI